MLFNCFFKSLKRFLLILFVFGCSSTIANAQAYNPNTLTALSAEVIKWGGIYSRVADEVSLKNANSNLLLALPNIKLMQNEFAKSFAFIAPYKAGVGTMAPEVAAEWARVTNLYSVSDQLDALWNQIGSDPRYSTNEKSILTGARNLLDQ